MQSLVFLDCFFKSYRRKTFGGSARTNKKGCFFHFSQAIFRMIQSLGLQNKYKDDENFAHKVRMLVALAFVPLPDVIDAFESVADEFPLMLKK